MIMKDKVNTWLPLAVFWVGKANLFYLLLLTTNQIKVRLPFINIFT